jgi:hypothetical protein
MVGSWGWRLLELLCMHFGFRRYWPKLVVGCWWWFWVGEATIYTFIGDAALRALATRINWVLKEHVLDELVVAFRYDSKSNSGYAVLFGHHIGFIHFVRARGIAFRISGVFYASSIHSNALECCFGTRWRNEWKKMHHVTFSNKNSIHCAGTPCPLSC